ncbi:MAG: hypothetical protein ACI86H_002714, partial [bacterium]
FSEKNYLIDKYDKSKIFIFFQGHSCALFF